MPPETLQDLNADLARRLLRMRCLDRFRLDGCEPVFRICRQKRWSYIVVFKKGRTPCLWEEARRKCRRRPHNAKTAKRRDGTVQHFSWAACLPHGKETVHAVFCNENCADGSEKQWAWVTDRRPDNKNVQPLTNKELVEEMNLKARILGRLDTSSTGTVLNIAEGHGRETVADQNRFMKTAQEHAYQTLVLLDVLAARKEVASTRVAEGKATQTRIIKMLHAWCERKNTEDAGRAPG